MIIEELSELDDYVTYCQLLSQLSVIDLDVITPADFIARVKLIQQNPFHKIFVAKEDSKIIGTATLLIEPKFIHNLSYVGHIEDVVVLETHRGQGIGKKLVKHCITYASATGSYKLILDCNDQNTVFYEKLGFKKKENQMALYVH